MCLFKGFFKRSILRKEKYRCYFGDKCVINSDNRNRCKSCRFQKCLKEGMSVEGLYILCLLNETEIL